MRCASSSASGCAAAELRGSWAGAMGQCQFMPSNYLAYAIDFEGDGKADIWTDVADVFASMGNFLGKLGWRGDEHWGYEVQLPQGFDRGLIDPDNTRRPIAEWQALGVRRPRRRGALGARSVGGSVAAGRGRDAAPS
jgi:membrane-bound lytic murein transglycosylase B